MPAFFVMPMYTATINSKEVVNGRINVVITFTSDKESFEETFGAESLRSLHHAARTRLAQLNRLEDILSKIPLGSFTPAEPTETPGETAARLEAEKDAKLARAYEKVTIKAITQEEYDALVAQIKST